jgi:ribosome hibernation promoting factor
MNVSITFRHMDPSEAIKRHAQDKLAKLQKFLRQPMTAKVTLSIDRLRHVAETRISSGGAHLEAKESSEDMYASIDKVMTKLERQIRGSKGAAQAKRRGGESVRSSVRRVVSTEAVAVDTGRAKDTRAKAKSKKRKAEGPKASGQARR